MLLDFTATKPLKITSTIARFNVYDRLGNYNFFLEPEVLTGAQMV
jgi:hypothetical protein